MIPHKLNGKLVFLALLGVILYFTSGVIMSLSKNQSLEDDLSPPAVTQKAAIQAAAQFAKDRLSLAIDDWQAAYETSKYTDGYVTRSKLQDEYASQFAAKIPLEYWRVTGTDESTDRTVQVRVSMDQPVVAAWQELNNRSMVHDEKGASTAMKALKDAGYNPDDFSYTSPAKKSEANLFTFVSTKEAIGEAPMAVKIGVTDDRVISFEPSFQIPESYMKWIKHQESLAGWMTGGFLLLTAAMGITAIVLAIIHRSRVHWTRGILLSAVFLVLYLIQNLNVTDALLASETSGEAEAAVAKVFVIVFVAITALLMTAAVWFSLLSGEQQWRMKGAGLWSRWRDTEFGQDVFYGMGRGYLICLFILGVQQIVFLAEANIFDSFGIPDATQSPLNMKWPLLFPTAAWVAAIMEEAIYRLFGVVLFKRMLRNNFLALLVTSVIWALGHTGYTLYPSYTRLIEVTILGFVFGYVFLKYGFITAVFAHATMDSLLMALYLMTGEATTVNILTGLLYIALPAIIGYAVRFLHPRFGGPRRKPPVTPPEEPRPWDPAESRLTPQE